jgi:hypothetical protein
MSKKMPCDCGCGREDYFARLKVLEVEYALDESLTRTRIGQRYYVRPGCYEPFIQELQAKRLLDGYLERMRNARWKWYQRLWRVRRILRIQYVIHIRNKGIDMTKRISVRSAILFVCSPRIAGIFWNYWRWADRNELKWRWNPYGRDLYWKSCLRPFRMLASLSRNITGTINRPLAVCLLLL